MGKTRIKELEATLLDQIEEPERYAQMQAKHKAYAKEWHKRKKEM